MNELKFHSLIRLMRHPFKKEGFEIRQLKMLHKDSFEKRLQNLI